MAAAATAAPGAALVADAAVYGGVDISSCASCCNLGSILSTVRVQFAAAAQLLLPQWPLLLTLSLVPHGRFLGSPAGPTDGRKLGADTIAFQGKARANPQNEVRCDTFMIIFPVGGLVMSPWFSVALAALIVLHLKRNASTWPTAPTGLQSF